MNRVIVDRPRRPTKTKFNYEGCGNVVHAARRLNSAERKSINSPLDELKKLYPNARDNRERVKELMGELGALPVKLVPVKSETRIGRSKSYPYASKKRGG